MHQIKQFRITSKHDHGYFTMIIFGHSSAESAIETFMDIEKCPRSAIIQVEDLSTRPRTAQEVLSLS